MFYWWCSLRAGSLVCYSQEYLGSGAVICELARSMGWEKVILHESDWTLNSSPCEVTSPHYPGIKYLTNTSEAKYKQTRRQIFALERSSVCTGIAKKKIMNTADDCYRLLNVSFLLQISIEPRNLVICPQEIKSRTYLCWWVGINARERRRH